jgi:protease secretion system membrane fusion protein
MTTQAEVNSPMTPPVEDAKEKPAAPQSKPIDMNDARPRRWGWWLLLVGFGGFMAWATMAPLDAGVSAPGMVVVTGNRKVVQPVMPGKIAAILVKDGDTVKAGQVLVKLDDTQARAQLEMTLAQWYSALAVEARLKAEREGRTSVTYPESLLDAKGDPRAVSAMTLQNELFATRKRALESELAILREGITGLEIQVKGLDESRQARLEQIQLLREEIRNQRSLVNDGFLPRNRLSEQERQLSALLAASSEDVSNLGRTRQGIVETRARILSRQAEFRREIESQLTDVQREAASLTSRVDALAFEVTQAEIRSPADGIVVGLTVHTVGGVVQSGASLMDIVPENEPLRIEAQIQPFLIDKIHPGLDVDILFPAFQQSTTPHVPGKLVTVSADVLFDSKGLPYYKAMVEVTPEGMKSLRQHQIRPGMPAESFVRTGERTLANYLIKPLTDRLQGALTEQ